MHEKGVQLQKYITEIETYPPLQDEEEKALARKAHDENHSRAKEQLARANLKLVVKIAEVYHNHSPQIYLIDLIEEGNLGLFKAVEMYTKNSHFEKDYKFSTYATWWIRQAIIRKLGIKEID